jgi:mannose/fructose/N-acetylgalactosamine-specific phosphotransferase system component IID
MFEVNEGVLDRIIRGIVGVALIIISILLLESTLKIVIIVIGVIVLVTGLSGFCGLYKILGINTCKIKSNKK